MRGRTLGAALGALAILSALTARAEPVELDGASVQGGMIIGKVSPDSRVILDTTGAERLLGQGDMLFQSPDAAAPGRLLGCLVRSSECS